MNTILFAFTLAILHSLIFCIFIVANVLGRRLEPGQDHAAEKEESKKNWRHELIGCLCLVVVIGGVYFAMAYDTLWMAVVTFAAWGCTVGFWLMLLMPRTADFRIQPKALAVTVPVLLGTATICLWLFVDHWITSDIVAALIAVAPLSCFRNIPIRKLLPHLFRLYPAIILLDILLVWGSDDMLNLATRAAGLRLPLMLVIPLPLSGMLGLGDIFIPGLLVMPALREAERSSMRALGIAALAGYMAALLVSGIAAWHFGPQPATIYLCPAVLGSFLFAAWRKGRLGEFLRKQ